MGSRLRKSEAERVSFVVGRGCFCMAYFPHNIVYG
jgi:hypothetical protein